MSTRFDKYKAAHKNVAKHSTKTLQNTQSYLQIAGVKPSILLEGEVPRLIDEWQMAPVLWDAVRHMVDIRGERGQFILTGSTLPLDSETMHSGTGRISKMLMRTMSLYESGESNGKVSLESLFNDEDVSGTANLDIFEVAFVVCRGGLARINWDGE